MSFPVSPIRVAIIDDHPVMRQCLLHTFHQERGFEVVGQGECSADAVTIAELVLPDVMLLDISMPGDGIEAAKVISRNFPAVRIMMLTAHDGEVHAVEALRAGACAFVVKGISSNELIASVRATYEGEGYVSPALAATLLNKGTMDRPAFSLAPNPVGLTWREEEILKHVSAGKGSRAIGGSLGMTEKTVKHYMTNILLKLHAWNRVQAVFIQTERLSSST